MEGQPIDLASYRKRSNEKLLGAEHLEEQVVNEERQSHLADVDITQYRLDQADKRHDALQAQLTAISNQLTDIKVAIATQPIRADYRNSTIGLIAVIISSLGFYWFASSNQLSSFQAGLSAVQTAVAVHQERSSTTGNASSENGAGK